MFAAIVLLIQPWFFCTSKQHRRSPRFLCFLQRKKERKWKQRPGRNFSLCCFYQSMTSASASDRRSTAFCLSRGTAVLQLNWTSSLHIFLFSLSYPVPYFTLSSQVYIIPRLFLSSWVYRLWAWLWEDTKQDTGYGIWMLDVKAWNKYRNQIHPIMSLSGKRIQNVPNIDRDSECTLCCFRPVTLNSKWSGKFYNFSCSYRTNWTYEIANIN